MKAILVRLSLFIAVLFLFHSAALATGPATVYKVKISKFEISSDGVTWITLFEGTSDTLDIAAVSAGSAAGSFLSGLPIPDGTYTQVRVTPAPTFTISGNDGANYTTAAVGGNGGSTPGGAGAQAECTITLTGGNVPPTSAPQDFSATPITVKDGVADRKVRVSFDVSNAIQYIAGPNEIYPAAPVVTMAVE